MAPLGDGEGRKNIKFHYFFGQSRTPVPTDLWEYFGRAHEISHSIVGVGALDDPEKQSYTTTQPPSPLCASKTFRWKFFAELFFKKATIKATKIKGEPPTRVLPLSLQSKEIHPLLRFTNDRRVALSAESALGRRPKNPQAFEKA